MLASLSLVAIEDFGRGLATHDHAEFPGKVGGIANAAVVTLALPYRHEMCRITRDQRAAFPEGASEACVVRVYAASQNICTFRVWQCARQQLPYALDGAELFFGFIAHHHELKPSHAVGQRDGHE